MAKYLLDTNILSYLEDPSSMFHGPVSKKLSLKSAQDKICISILSLYELHYSVACADDDLKEDILRSLHSAKTVFSVFPLCHEGAEIFGNLKKTFREYSAVSKKELERHNSDLMIASTAISEGATLVSNDRIFEVLEEFHPDFHYENWALE